MRAAKLLGTVAILGLAAPLAWNPVATEVAGVRDRIVEAFGPSKAVQPKPATAIRVSVEAVQAEDVEILLKAIGTVKAYNSVVVRARVDGELTKVEFREGQDVEAGDVLAQVDPRPYEAQLARQHANRAKHQALLDIALLNLDRYNNLMTKDFVSRQLYETQAARVTGIRGQLGDDEAAIAYAQTQLDYATIRSPISGRVGIRQVDQGNFVRAAENTAIVVVTQLRPISVVFSLPANAAAQGGLLPGRADIGAMAYSSDGGTKLDDGRVELVDNQVDSATGTIKVKATFPNRDLRLWPGDFVNGRLVVETKRGGLTVSESALRHGPLGDFVWVVRSDMTVLSRRVKVAQTNDGRVLLVGGVSRGERVVTQGHFRLEENARVEIVKAPPSARAVAQQ